MKTRHAIRTVNLYLILFLNIFYTKNFGQSFIQNGVNESQWQGIKGQKVHFLPVSL